MNLEHELTHIQKMAFQGEMALTLSTATHDAEVLYRLYLVLKETPEKFRPLIVEVTKELVTMPEEEIDRVVLEVLEGSVPVWIWIEKTIADLKESIIPSEMPFIAPMRLNKARARKMITESAFVRFARQIIELSPSTASKLFQEILDDPGLSFLHVAAFTLMSRAQEMSAINKEEDGVDEVIFDCVFNLREILSSIIETEALEVLNNPKKARKHLNKMLSSLGKRVESHSDPELIGAFEIPMDNMISQDDLSKFLSAKISELFNDVSGTSKAKPKSGTKSKYIVRKTFKGSNASSTLKVFNTKEEALEFVTQLKKDFPELEKTCTFEVLKDNSKKKH